MYCKYTSRNVCVERDSRRRWLNKMKTRYNPGVSSLFDQYTIQENIMLNDVRILSDDVGGPEESQ